LAGVGILGWAVIDVQHPPGEFLRFANRRDHAIAWFLATSVSRGFAKTHRWTVSPWSHYHHMWGSSRCLPPPSCRGLVGGIQSNEANGAVCSESRHLGRPWAGRRPVVPVAPSPGQSVGWPAFPRRAAAGLLPSAKMLPRSFPFAADWLWKRQHHGI